MPRTGVPIRKRGDRWQGDFRKYGDKQRTLSPELIGEPGGKFGVTTQREADRIANEYVRQLSEGRPGGSSSGPSRPVTLSDYADEFVHYLRSTPRPNGEYRTLDYVKYVERCLASAIEFFGGHRPLGAIEPADVEEYLNEVRSRGLSGRTVRVYLDKLGQLYRRAVRHRVVTFNPVDAIRDELPSGTPQIKRRALESSEAWALMEAARQYDLNTGHYMYPLITLWLHSGIGPKEAFTRRVEDICFAKPGDPVELRGGTQHSEGVVVVEPNGWSGHRLKTAYRPRRVPLWPDCAAVLAEYVSEMHPSSPLFPSPRRTGEPIRGVKKAFKSVVQLAGLDTAITPYWLRHTYASHRIQTTEGGAPVHELTITRELGHGSMQMIEQHYGHLLRNRTIRGEVVSYRPGPQLLSNEETG
jgi:integrase